jgi:hypothetical protein
MFSADMSMENEDFWPGMTVSGVGTVSDVSAAPPTEVSLN